MAHSASPLSPTRIEERVPAVEPGHRPLAADEDPAGGDARAGYAWLWPWVLASIGFLMTLALLR
jgi:hypothetical protein